MRLLALLSVAMLIALPLWVATTSPAHACTCAPRTLEEQVEAAEFIVVGTPLDAELPQPTPPPLSPPNSEELIAFAVVPVLVEEYIKGAGPDELRVDGPPFRVTLGPGGEVEVEPIAVADCRTLGLEGGGRFLLLLVRRSSGSLGTSSCDGSLRLNQGDESFFFARIEEVRLILQGVTPTATESATAAPEHPTPTAGLKFPPSGSGGGGAEDSSVLWPSLAGAGAAMLLGSGALLALRRRDR